jgi:hypothetical protein
MSRPAAPAFTHADNNGLICVRGHESGRAAKSTLHTLHLDFIVQFCEMGRTHYCLRCGNVPCSGCRRHSRRRRRFGADCIACVHLVQPPGVCGRAVHNERDQRIFSSTDANYCSGCKQIKCLKCIRIHKQQ